ncbi:MAG: hypothetical protein MUO23_05640 [Anaerolineales bacterium]|nr:hypothetical protein [Anaerolineales bacterium]
MPLITCFGEANEIGGNKILLEEGDRRIFFDFGKPFGRYGSFFDGVYMRERVSRGLLDVLALGLVPPLRGLLRDDLIPAFESTDVDVQEVPPQGRQRVPRQVTAVTPQAQDTFWEHWQRSLPHAYRDLRRKNAPAVDAVLLSHAHQDHISDLQYVSAEIPGAASRMTAFIGKVLLDAGLSGLGGVPYVAPRAPRPEGELASERNSPYRGRPFHFFDHPLDDEPSQDPLETAAGFWAYGGSKGIAQPDTQPTLGLRLRTYPVDHSLFGAVGMAVETDAGWIGYTGDLRFHGTIGAQTWAFADALAGLSPAALLCEGTRLSGANATTEAMVMDRCLQAVRRASGRLAVADFAPRNVERLLTFLAIAGETGRRLLVQPKDAYLLRAMHLADPGVPDAMADSRLGLYADPKVTQFDWERRIRARYAGSVVAPMDVRQAPGDFLLAFSLTDLADLLDIEYSLKGKPGGVYVFSNSQAYDDEQMVDLVRLWNWTEHLGLTLEGLEPHRDSKGAVVKVTPVEGFHASGHAAADELVEFVRRSRPKRLIAIHTENPAAWHGLLRGMPTQLILPEYATPIPL